MSTIANVAGVGVSAIAVTGLVLGAIAVARQNASAWREPDTTEYTLAWGKKDADIEWADHIKRPSSDETAIRITADMQLRDLAGDETTLHGITGWYWREVNPRLVVKPQYTGGTVTTGITKGKNSIMSEFGVLSTGGVYPYVQVKGQVSWTANSSTDTYKLAIQDVTHEPYNGKVYGQLIWANGADLVPSTSTDYVISTYCELQGDTITFWQDIYDTTSGYLEARELNWTGSKFRNYAQGTNPNQNTGENTEQVFRVEFIVEYLSGSNTATSTSVSRTV